MGLVEDIGTYLAAQSTRFTLGTNLYLNFMPSTLATSAAIYETGGLPPSRTFAPSTSPAWENARIQVVCRSTSSTKARANVDTAWTVLEGISNVALPTSTGTYYLRVASVQSPFLLMRDDAGSILFAFNCDVLRRL